MLKTAITYFKERQSSTILILHIMLIVLVITQIILSNFLEIEGGKVSQVPLEFYGTWLHIITGICLIPITLVFIVVEIRTHQLKYFFPYLFGELTQIKNDLTQLKKFSLPEPKDYGIAAAIQGLGLGALTLVLISGFSWYLSWQYGNDAVLTHDLKDLHETLTGLVQAYIIGHGLAGLIHIFYAKNHE